MYAAYMNGLDGLVFTGGIGLGSAVVRRLVCEKLGSLGVQLDEKANEGRGDGRISTEGSRVKVWRLKTNEELVVARCVEEMLNAKL